MGDVDKVKLLLYKRLKIIKITMVCGWATLCISSVVYLIPLISNITYKYFIPLIIINALTIPLLHFLYKREKNYTKMILITDSIKLYIRRDREED